MKETRFFAFTPDHSIINVPIVKITIDATKWSKTPKGIDWILKLFS
ncbi:MAG: hypothetical protein JZD40_07495 [Sulfolobus sp.]|nr:hypothetical protein [Sulfolobus sp.]